MGKTMHGQHLQSLSRLPMLPALGSPALSTLSTALDKNMSADSQVSPPSYSESIHPSPLLWPKATSIRSERTNAPLRHLWSRRHHQNVRKLMISSPPVPTLEPVRTSAMPHAWSTLNRSSQIKQVDLSRHPVLDTTSFSSCMITTRPIPPIMAEPMKSNKSGPEILAAYKRVHKKLVQASLRPQLQRLDNKCSGTSGLSARYTW